MERITNFITRRGKKQNKTSERPGMAGDYDNDDGDDDDGSKLTRKTKSSALTVTQNYKSVVSTANREKNNVISQTNNNKSDGPHACTLKKKSSFQITNVVKSTKSVDVNDDCYESADESEGNALGKTETDNSDNDDDDDNEADTKDETYIQQLNSALNVAKHVPRSLSCMFPASGSQALSTISTTPQVTRTSISSSCNSLSTSVNSPRPSTISRFPSDKRSRFRIVKLRSAQPFTCGRWTCLDYIDSPIVNIVSDMNPMCLTPTRATERTFSHAANIPTSDIGSSLHSVYFSGDNEVNSAVLYKQLPHLTSAQMSQSTDYHHAVAPMCPSDKLQRSVSMHNVRDRSRVAVDPKLSSLVYNNIVPPENLSADNLNHSHLVDPGACFPPSQSNSLAATFQSNHSDINVNNSAFNATDGKNPSMPYSNNSISFQSMFAKSIVVPSDLGSLSTIQVDPYSSRNSDLRRTVSDANLLELRKMYPEAVPAAWQVPSSDVHLTCSRRFEKMTDVLEEELLMEEEEEKTLSNISRFELTARRLSNLERFGIQSASLERLCDSDTEAAVLEDHYRESEPEILRINDRITEAMELVKEHLMYAVNDEVRQLLDRIHQLTDTHQHLVQENLILRKNASPETLAKLEAVTFYQSSSSADNE